jgi:hypothetical protein
MFFRFSGAPPDSAIRGFTTVIYYSRPSTRAFYEGKRARLRRSKIGNSIAPSCGVSRNGYRILNRAVFAWSQSVLTRSRQVGRVVKRWASRIHFFPTQTRKSSGATIFCTLVGSATQRYRSAGRVPDRPEWDSSLDELDGKRGGSCPSGTGFESVRRTARHGSTIVTTHGLRSCEQLTAHRAANNMAARASGAGTTARSSRSTTKNQADRK